MKKIIYGVLVIFILILAVGCGDSQVKREEAIFDGTAKNFISSLNSVAQKMQFSLGDPKYNKSGNDKYCTVNFGGSENNKLNLKLNEDDSVIYAEIMVPNDYEAGIMAGALLAGTVNAAGATQEELNNLHSAYASAVAEEVQKQNNVVSPIINRKFNAYCSQTKKNLEVEVNGDASIVRFFIAIKK